MRSAALEGEARGRARAFLDIPCARRGEAATAWRLQFLGLLLLLAWSHGVGHAQEGLSVRHLDVTLVVGREGALEVEERVQLVPRQGSATQGPPMLHRPLPLQLPSLYGHGMRRIRWGAVDVTGSGGEPQRWQLRGRSGGQAILSTQTPSASESVTLRFVGHGLVERRGQRAGFRWTLVPWNWERNIRSVNVWLVLPVGVTGVQASIQGAGQDRGLRGTDELESRFLFQLDLADSSLAGDPPVVEARWDGDILRPQSLISLVRQGFSTYWPLLLPLLSVGFLARQRRLRRPVPEGGPLPADLTSAESGFLLNLQVEPRDLVATLLELERAGGVEFQETGGASPLLGLRQPRRVLLVPRPGALPDDHPGLATLRELVGPELNATSLGNSPEALPRALRTLHGAVETSLVNRGFLERPLSQMAGRGVSLAVGFLLVGVALAGLGVEYLLLMPGVAYGAALLFALPLAFRHYLVPPWTPAGRKAQAAVQTLQRELARSPVDGMEAWQLALVGPMPAADPSPLRGAGAASPSSIATHLLEEVEDALTPARGWREVP
ncbi:MAG: hypothetical protein WEA09_01640 [Gemmatimonadota bacterium]